MTACAHEFRHLRQLETIDVDRSDGSWERGSTVELFYCIFCLHTTEKTLPPRMQGNYGSAIEERPIVLQTRE